MPIKTWSAGLGGATGDELGTEAPIMVSGTVYYVDSQTGSDSNSGLREDAPKATLAAALALVSTNDIVCCLSGHEETLTAALASSVAGLTIVGMGSAAGIPTVELTMNAAAANTFTLTGAGQQVFGIRFMPNLQANSGHMISVGAANQRIRNCYFGQGEHDNGSGISIAGTHAGVRIEDCTFVSVATSVATRPVSGISVTAATTYLNLDGVTIDAGTNGYSSNGINITSTATSLRVERLSLLRGADASIESASTGYVSAPTVTGGAVLVW